MDMLLILLRLFEKSTHVCSPNPTYVAGWISKIASNISMENFFRAPLGILAKEVPRILLPILVAFLEPLSPPKLPSAFLGIPRYLLQRPKPIRPYCTPITRYIQK